MFRQRSQDLFSGSSSDSPPSSNVSTQPSQPCEPSQPSQSKSSAGCSDEDPFEDLDVSVEKTQLFCEQCKKSFKTNKNFKRHKILHVQKESMARVSKEDLYAVAVILAEDIIQEILEDPVVGDFAEQLFQYLKNISLNFNCPDFAVFVKYLTDAFVPILTEKTKVMPQKQYEKNLQLLHHFLTDEDVRNEMKSMLRLVHDEEDSVLNVFVYRFSTKFFTKLQVEILKTMRRQEHTVGLPDFSFTFEEKQTLYYASGYLVRALLKKGKMSSATSIWNKRCTCIKKNFIFKESDSVSEFFMKIKSWHDSINRGGLIAVNEKLFDVFFNIECIVRSHAKNDASGAIIKPASLFNEVIHPRNEALLQSWFEMTQLLLSEPDSLQFLEIVVINFVKFSGRAEAEKRKRELTRNKNFKTIALRTDLKRN